MDTEEPLIEGRTQQVLWEAFWMAQQTNDHTWPHGSPSRRVLGRRKCFAIWSRISQKISGFRWFRDLEVSFHHRVFGINSPQSLVDGWLALGEFTTSSDTKFDRQDAVAKPPIHEDGCRVYSIWRHAHCHMILHTYSGWMTQQKRKVHVVNPTKSL